MKIIMPRVFAPLQNNVPLSYLDDNFTALNNLFANMGFQYFYNIDQYASLTAAVASIGAIPCTVLINVGTSITANTTVPATMQLLFLYPGTINLGGFNLTINSLGMRPSYNPILGTGTVTGLFMAQATTGTWFGTPTGSRALSTVYQNLTPNPIFCNAIISMNAGTYIQALCDASVTPVTVVDTSVNMAAAAAWSVTNRFVVPPNFYYKVVPSAGGSIVSWVEWN